MCSDAFDVSFFQYYWTATLCALSCYTLFPQGLGLSYCQSLVGNGCHLLVTTSRTAALPLEVLSALAASGCTVFSVSADAREAPVLQQVLSWASEQLPRLEHIVHAAGISNFTMLTDLELSSFRDIVDVKVGVFVINQSNCS